MSEKSAYLWNFWWIVSIPSASTSTALLFFEQFFAALVENFAFLFIAENFVSRAQILEFLVGIGVVSVSVRVELFGKLSVRFLDGVCVSVLFHPENFVEIPPEE